MKLLVDLTTWLLEKDIRAKNALSFLCALITVGVVYFASNGSAWVESLDDRGPFGLPTALVAIFLASFLSYWLVASAWRRATSKRNALRKREAAAVRQEQQIVQTLESLTDWQRGFVIRFIAEGTTQIHEHEIGGYKVVWGPEVEMLVQKGVVRRHRRAGVYEISPVLRTFLLDHWDPETGTLD